MGLLRKLIDTEYKELKRFGAIADKVMALDEEMQKLSDDELKAKTEEFKKRLEKGETLDDLIVEAFAVVREAADRVIHEKPFRVQIIGGLTLHFGNIAEMKTGEGKTLTATMPTYLNALTGKGVHIVTVNEFLAQRDSEWMGAIYKFLGLTVGLNTRELSEKEKQEMYNCDILYSTNNEIGFDYLRDNMVVKAEDRVQRPLNYCIVDEVDSILIDEARTPLIISGGQANSSNLYIEADRVAKKLQNEVDYTIDEKTKSVSLTAEGSEHVEKIARIKNLYDLENTAFVHHLNQALKANYAFKIDVDYVIENGEVIIVDQFTGRLMHGRQFSEGLHQALEAKEGVQINVETKTMATITFQNLFRMYNKLSGMTGTAKTEEEEFRAIYNMYVIQIPTNLPIARIDEPDLVYSNIEGKYKSIVNAVKHIHETGQPILIGTISVEVNEYLSTLLTKAGLKHEILNAKNHAREAEIIAKAGQKGAITLATNMAGRGTDIKLGEGVKELGGLYVIGTERHESRRIDNQLRGRAGRQGDPGFSRFYVSFEDELLIRFAADNVKNYIEKNFGDEALESKMVSNIITSAQKKIEGQNFDTRKSLLEYDDVLAKQRQIVYDKRDRIIEGKPIDDIFDEIFSTTGTFLANKSIPAGAEDGMVSGELLIKTVEPRFLPEGTLKKNLYDETPVEECAPDLGEVIRIRYMNNKKTFKADPESIDKFERAIILHCIDQNWTKHIDAMDKLREGIFLRSYANVNPLQDYVNEGYRMFREMLEISSVDAVLNLVNLRPRERTPEEEQPQPQPEVVDEQKPNDDAPKGE